LDVFCCQLPRRSRRPSVAVDTWKGGNQMTPIETGESILFPTAEDCATYDGPEAPEPGETYVIGWDPARSIDYSGVAIRNSKGQVMKVERLHEFLSTGQSTAFRNGLANAIGKAKQRERALPLRVYTPRSQAFQEGGEVKTCENQ
jgi:trehalose utilization protein